VIGDPDLLEAAIALAEKLRDALPGLRLEVNAGGGSMKSQLRRADRSGAALALLLGHEEVAAGEVTVKDLRGQAEQARVAMDALQKTLLPLCAQ